MQHVSFLGHPCMNSTVFDYIMVTSEMDLLSALNMTSQRLD